MAHALEYEHFIKGAEMDIEFRNDFEKYRQLTGPLFINVLLGKPSYLRNYAYTNMREFWAVTVEAFFENPNEFKKEMPALYKRVADVLNQDPLMLHEIVVHPE